MNPHIIVCPYDRSVLDRLRGNAIVITVDNFEDIMRAANDADIFQTHIHCIRVKTNSPISNIVFKDEWEKIPLAVYVPSMGSFRIFIKQLALLKKLNIKFYLPVNIRENYTSLRILSSLGIESAVVFKGNSLDWEILSDLMVYSLLGLIPHAIIEPFHYIQTHYQKCERTDYSSLYFEDPSKYLHISNEGRIALTSEDLAAEIFLPMSVDELSAIGECEEYVNSLENWRDSFLKADGCASCQAWRVCLGRFSDAAKKDRGCEKFFAELMDVVEQYNSQNQKKKSLWQPS